MKHLRNSESTKEDWKQLLTRQPSHISNLEEFQQSIRLFYSKDEVAKFNYDHLLDLKQPIAQINARHSTNKAKVINAQDMYGLQPTLLIAKKARVMLTMNLWPSAGLCNGATQGWIQQWFLRGVPGESSGEGVRPLGGSGAFPPENFEN